MVYNNDNVHEALEKIAAQDAADLAAIGAAIAPGGFGAPVGAALGAKEGRKGRASAYAIGGNVLGNLGGAGVGGVSGGAAGAAIMKALQRRYPGKVGAGALAGLTSGGILGAYGGGVYGAYKGAKRGASKRRKGHTKKSSVHSSDNIHEALEKIAAIQWLQMGAGMRSSLTNAIKRGSPIALKSGKERGVPAHILAQFPKKKPAIQVFGQNTTPGNRTSWTQTGGIQV